jgi:hypothetical protein
MTPKGRPRPEGQAAVKTTVDLPEPLWRAVKIRAMDERTDLRAIVITALEAYLKTRPKRREEEAR